MDDCFPIRVASNYEWAHSLAMDDDLKEKFEATPDTTPFVVHAGEGVDESAAAEVFELDRLNALDERTVLVHGLALSPKAIDLLNVRNAALVWCPSSNRYLFGRTHAGKQSPAFGVYCFGSDSRLPRRATCWMRFELHITKSECLQVSCIACCLASG